jgi:hypothetical protein
MNRVDLAVAGAAAGVSPLAFPAHGWAPAAWLIALVVAAAVSGGVLTARRDGPFGTRTTVVAGLLLLGVAVPFPRPQAAGTALAALALCACAAALVATCLLLKPASAARQLAANSSVLLLAACAGCLAATLWLAEASAAVGVLACTCALLHLARSATPTRSSS